MEGKKARISLVIPSIGRPAIGRIKAAISQQTLPLHEVIIQPDHHRKGPGWARTQGFYRSTGDLVAFIDDDCIPHARWLETMAAAMEHYNADMISSHYDETDPFLHEIRIRRKLPTEPLINPDGFVGTGGNILFRSLCLQACLDQDGFLYHPVFSTYGCEDVELASRLHSRGFKLVFIDNRIRHQKKISASDYLVQQFRRGIGICLFYRIQKASKRLSPPDRSLLWKHGQKPFPGIKWMIMIWKKLIGPFDRRSFSSLKNFTIFWTGEKCQGIGFLYGLFFKIKKND